MTKIVKFDCDLSYGFMPFFGLNSSWSWAHKFGESSGKEKVRAFWGTSEVKSTIKSPRWKFWKKDKILKTDIYLIGSLDNLLESSHLREYEIAGKKELGFNYPSDPAYLKKLVLEENSNLSSQQISDLQKESESNNQPDDPDYPLLSYAKSMTQRSLEARGIANKNRISSWKLGTKISVFVIAAVTENRETENGRELLLRPIYIR